MKKNKQINIRLTENYYQALLKISERLDCTMTEYFLERGLSPDIVRVQNICKTEHGKYIGSISRNLNQLTLCAHAMRKLIEEKDVVERDAFVNDIDDLIFSIQNLNIDFRKIIDLIKDEEIKCCRYLYNREILPEIMEILEDEDPAYLDYVKDRRNRL